MTPLAVDVGQLFVVGFDGTSAPAALCDRLRAGRVGGAILFARNVSPDPLEVAALCAALAAAAPADRPALISVDQEGGRVARLRAPGTVWPAMAALGRLADEPLARAVGAAIGRELAVLGLNCDFAPVLDVHTNPANPVIGDRALAESPALVARLGVAFARGLEEDAGVAACGKHFPGHGDTAQDSHHELPTLPHGLDRLERIELVPFAAAAAAGVAMIMTAHVLFPALDPERPATLSPAVLGLLRERLGFRGVVVSDDLEMRAVAGRHPIEELAVLGLRAGCDLFLVCRDEELAERAFDALVREAEKDAELRRRVAESAERVRRLKARFCRARFTPDRARIAATLGAPAHRALAARLAGATAIAE